MKQLPSKIPVGVLGATGMVGQRFVSLLANHPWFEVVAVAASEKSADKLYTEAVKGRWMMKDSIPEKVAGLTVQGVERDMADIAGKVRIVFSAIEADKDFIIQIENAYAALGVAVVSNNSAHRWSDDVPMIIPEVNPEHLSVISAQRKNRNWKGCIVVKPNCSIQCYVPLLKAWEAFEPKKVLVSTYQAISGAGKNFETWPEMIDNVIPFIGGEEEKSEKEPLKVLGKDVGGKIENTSGLTISASCIRVPVSDGHMASVAVEFGKPATRKALIAALAEYKNPIDEYDLPSAPKPFITYFPEDNRPQGRLDRDRQGGMGLSVGRLREDPILGFKCVALSHNTLRGAAGGGVLSAELLVAKGFVTV